MKVKDIKTTIKKTALDTTITEAARVMSEKRIGSLLVEDGEKLVGIITERDILRKVVVSGMDPTSTTVKDIMSSPLIKIEEDSDIEAANDMMVEKKIRRLITTKDGKDTGIVTLTDISKNMKYLFAKRLIR